MLNAGGTARCSMVASPVAVLWQVTTYTRDRARSRKRNAHGRLASSARSFLFLLYLSFSHRKRQVFNQISSVGSMIQEVNLVETSIAMRSLQKTKLSPLAEKYGWDVKWNTSINDIPRDTSVYTIIIAHEFFDALPFHLLQVKCFPLGRLSINLTISRKPIKDGKKS